MAPANDQNPHVPLKKAPLHDATEMDSIPKRRSERILQDALMPNGCTKEPKKNQNDIATKVPNPSLQRCSNQRANRSKPTLPAKIRGIFVEDEEKGPDKIMVETPKRRNFPPPPLSRRHTYPPVRDGDTSYQAVRRPPYTTPCSLGAN